MRHWLGTRGTEQIIVFMELRNRMRETDTLVGFSRSQNGGHNHKKAKRLLYRVRSPSATAPVSLTLLGQLYGGPSNLLMILPVLEALFIFESPTISEQLKFGAINAFANGSSQVWQGVLPLIEALAASHSQPVIHAQRTLPPPSGNCLSFFQSIKEPYAIAYARPGGLRCTSFMIVQ